jgi:ferritin-like protein
MTEEKINVVGVNVLKQNGANVDEILKQLIYNASIEFTAYYYFTNLRTHATGLDGEGVKGVIEDARLEDLSPFESCITRIHELGGSLPNDAIEFIRMSGCEFLQLPAPTTNLKEIPKKCLTAEQGAIVNWNKMCNLTIGKDHATYEIAKDILKEEIEHESWFLELLYSRPSEHMRRKFPGERPHTHKHSRALG